MLDRVWVNLLATGDAVSAYSSIDRDRGHDLDGEVVTFAGGRQRFIGQDGVKTHFAFTLRRVSPATIDTLRGWMGRVVQVRDRRGQRFFGVYSNVAVKEQREAALYDVTLTTREVTLDEGV